MLAVNQQPDAPVLRLVANLQKAQAPSELAFKNKRKDKEKKEEKKEKTNKKRKNRKTEQNTEERRGEERKAKSWPLKFSPTCI